MNVGERFTVIKASLLSLDKNPWWNTVVMAVTLDGLRPEGGVVVVAVGIGRKERRRKGGERRKNPCLR